MLGSFGDVNFYARSQLHIKPLTAKTSILFKSKSSLVYLPTDTIKQVITGFNELTGHSTSDRATAEILKKINNTKIDIKALDVLKVCVSEY